MFARSSSATPSAQPSSRALRSPLTQLETAEFSFDHFNDNIDLSSLAVGCPNLTSLHTSINAQRSPGLIATIRALPRLTDLQCREINVVWLEQLTAPPHALQLRNQMYSMSDLFTERAIPVLVRLPTLTKLLIGQFIDVHSLRFLAAFPALSSLSLSTLPPQPLSTVDDIVGPIAACRSVTSLAIHGQLTVDEWTVILSALPLLSELTMQCNAALQSLQCFPTAGPSLARSLTSLYLYRPSSGCRLRSRDLKLLRCLSHLTQLHVGSFGPKWLDAETRVALSPPSVWLPRLERLMLPEQLGWTIRPTRAN